MLSESARPYIDASVPVLREHGLAITSHFYAALFTAHPELKNVFNMSNQADGLQQQSLAAAVFAYAANYRNPNALAPVVERIVHKHASLGVLPAHYPIVGQHLLASIKAILGDAATPELLAAWDEAYGVLARVLIDEEAKLYAQTGGAAGEFRNLVVSSVCEESAEVKSFYLTAEGGGSPGGFHPGQYITVSAKLGELRQLRQYSLSDSPDKPWWRITVKREGDGGNSVSTWLVDNLKAGDILPASGAFGDFRPTIDSDMPIVLLSAGVGITPMVAVLNAIVVAKPQRRVLFGHAARQGRHHPLRGEVRDARTKLAAMTEVQFYETPDAEDKAGVDYHHTGRMSLASLGIDQLPDASFYLCGPRGFMQQQWRDLIAAGVSPTRIHREVFGPDLLDHLI